MPDWYVVDSLVQGGDLRDVGVLLVLRPPFSCHLNGRYTTGIVCGVCAGSCLKVLQFSLAIVLEKNGSPLSIGRMVFGWTSVLCLVRELFVFKQEGEGNSTTPQQGILFLPHTDCVRLFFSCRLLQTNVIDGAKWIQTTFQDELSHFLDRQWPASGTHPTTRL